MLPKHLEGYAEDAAEQIRLAVELPREDLRRRSRGACGPRKARSARGSSAPSPTPASNGSPPTRRFSPARPTAGFRATATATSAIRKCSIALGAWKSRARALQIVFRDHAMSDQIGFHYQRYAPEHAVDDFIGKLEAIGRATGGNAGHRPTLVSIILDGENCWEYYPNGGVDFLRGALPARRPASADQARAGLRLSASATRPPTSIGHLFPGSWIQHNFGIWIGHPECNRAWDLLLQTRQHLLAAHERRRRRRRATRPGLERNVHRRRERLVLVVRRQPQQRPGRAVRSAVPQASAERLPACSSEPPPTELTRPISQGNRAARTAQRAHRPARASRSTAGGPTSSGSTPGTTSAAARAGTMSMVPQGAICRPVFRLRHRAAAAAVGRPRRPGPRAIGRRRDDLRGRFCQPAGFELLVSRPGRQAAAGAIVAARLGGGRGRMPRRRPTMIFELAIPFRSLALEDRRAGPLLRRTAARASNRWNAFRTKARSKLRCPRPNMN